ncbi:MAG: hypothetical protein AYK19_20825 [Theionarchaea archaeon DG-70-1]|nr:MAG: hypothetical protein AYK19_20825 [Theionarchaea archaeon DG-70-1]
MSTTTVAVSKETKEMLRKLGEKGESYDSIIRTLIEEVSWKRLDNRWNKILKEDEFIPPEKTMKYTIFVSRTFQKQFISLENCMQERIKSALSLQISAISPLH